jgi:FkbM family methyltransferase
MTALTQLAQAVRPKRGAARRANRTAIRILAGARSAAISSPLPLFRPLAVLGQAEAVGTRRVRGVELKMLVEDYCDYAVFKSWPDAEPATLDWIDALPPGARFLDIGSNIGRFTLYAAMRHPAVGIAAVDPDARVSHRLARSAAINRCDRRLTQVLIAASDSDSHERIVFNRRLQQGHLRSSPSGETFGYVVETMRVDTMVDRRLIEPPTHIKIDVDGHEAAVLAGAERTLRDRALHSVLIEVDDVTAAPVATLMANAGLREASRAVLSSGLVNVVYERRE